MMWYCAAFTFGSVKVALIVRSPLTILASMVCSLYDSASSLSTCSLSRTASAFEVHRKMPSVPSIVCVTSGNAAAVCASTLLYTLRAIEFLVLAVKSGISGPSA